MWHFHQYGSLGVFFIDMRGDRITSRGIKKDGVIMSQEQFKALESALVNDDISCMIIAAKPFVTDTPAAVKKAAGKIFFSEGHWAYNVETTSKLFDMCFDWKAGKQGREVTLIGGDVHVGYTTRLSCNKTNQSLTAICTSPITNHVSSLLRS